MQSKNIKILIGFLVLIGLAGGAFYYFNLENQPQELAVQRASKKQIEALKKRIIENRFNNNNENENGGDTNPDNGNGYNTDNPDTGSGNNTDNPDTGTGHNTGTGYNTISYPSFSVLSGSGNNTINYSPRSEVFRFSVSAASTGDVVLNRITLESYSQGLNTGTSGIEAINSWELYNDSTGTSVAYATISQNKITFEIGAQSAEFIERGSRMNYTIFARIFDDGIDNQNSISTGLLRDYSSDVDADQPGIQYYGTYDEVNDPQDNNKIIWRDHDNQNKYLNSSRIPVDTRSTTYW